jgi:RNase H-fold protein (predicted Holliday junction resolvase)
VNEAHPSRPFAAPELGPAEREQALVDQVAAVLILQSYLDANRASATLPESLL